MKLSKLIWLIIGLLTVVDLHLHAQEIKNSQDAIKYFDKIQNMGIYIIEKTTRMDGVEENIPRRIIDYTLENEYLIFIMATETDKDGIKSYLNPKSLLLNLTDSLKLEKITWKKKNYSLFIAYKNFIFYIFPDLKWMPVRKNLSLYNSSIESLFAAISILKSTFDPAEKADFKLNKFKEEFLKSGTSKNITEEQRKYIVQANTANEAKDYGNAMILYRKAIDVNKFSYPDAYFNMALIAAQAGAYYQAIYAMKIYLILKPDAEDARKAQDKIYEWELNIK